ncbi:MAG: lectin [Verrucomicrobiae bacterium]|nr:lectin [Verrucomicrobiae bacterium]
MNRRACVRVANSVMLAAAWPWLAADVSASVLEGPFTNSANGHIYFMLNESTWTGAETEAISLGGHLVTINDSDENSWLISTFDPLITLDSDSFWIGLNDVDIEGTFRWISGEPVTFLNWDAGEPNQLSTSEDYCNMLNHNYGSGTHTGFWNDNLNTAYGVLAFGLVEVIPEPALTSLMLAAGVVAALGWRRARASSP